MHLFAEMGLVQQVFTPGALSTLPGRAAIGHTRYSTTGSSVQRNAQPFHVRGVHGEIAIAHNGNVVNAELMRVDLEEAGARFETSTDTEVLGQLLVSGASETIEDRFAELMRRANGAYSITVLTPEAVYAARDPLGIRPLCIGRLNGSGWIAASESCALSHLGAEFVRELQPGELVRLDEDGMTSMFPIGEPLEVHPERREAMCLFESIYFARPDSYLGGELLYPVRMRMGAYVAREHPVEADIVIGVPDSATAAAIGYAQEAGLPYAEGLIKNRYVGRTFIEPDQRLRAQGVQLKFNALREILEGKRVVVVDDSIVRGTTTPPIVQMIRDAGAAEVHMRITSPPIQHPCFYGVDMATRGELIAAQRSIPEILEHIGADSLGYLSVAGTIAATNIGADRHCTACFTGEYPGDVPLQFDKFALETEDVSDRHGVPVHPRS
jgi:amidophosphoribosyltransferase